MFSERVLMFRDIGKRFTFITVLLTVFAILCGCSDSVIVQEEVKRRESTGASWTVMIYMCGSTLEEDYGRAGEVLSSLSYDLPQNVNVVVETGGSRKWNTADIYPEYLQDFEVQKNGIRLVNQKPSENMGSSSTLSSFFEWGMDSYPADNYIGVIWDHGGGPIGGVAYDANNEFDSLSLSEIKDAMGSLRSKLDIIGFDASLMSNLETASALSLYADYLVASEDVMPMNGWDYRGLFEYISNNPSATASEVGGIICDGVKNGASEHEKELVSMAVTDLSNITTLTLAFDGMAEVMANAADNIDSLRNISFAMNELEYLGGNSKWEGYSNLVDIGELTNVVTEQIGSPAANIANAINKVVVYKAMSDYHNMSGGLSVYYPGHRDSDEISAYRAVSMSENYMEFIEKTCIDTEIDGRINNFEDAGAWAQYSELVKSNYMSAETDMSGMYVLNINHPEIITRAGVNFYMYSADNQGYLYLFRDYDTKYDEASGGYVYELSGRLPRLNSTPVAMYLVSQNTCFDIYSIPVIYEGEIANIRVSRSKQSDDYGEYTILGIWKGVDPESGMADRKYEELNNGDVIIPIYEMYGGEEGSYVEGSKIRIGFGGAKITEKLIDDGDYIVSYTAEDLYGITYECDTNNLTSTNGKIRIMNY